MTRLIAHQQIGTRLQIQSELARFTRLQFLDLAEALQLSLDHFPFSWVIRKLGHVQIRLKNERAPALLQASGVEARCEVVGGSFFEGVPPGADAYLLRAILHDWDDERSIAILKSIRNATVGGAVLLIVERVLPGKAEMGKAVDSYLLDLEMLVNTPGGRERSESEFREILNAAGFGPLRLIPTSTATSILEARPA
jgi:hypothetical protein